MPVRHSLTRLRELNRLKLHTCKNGKAGKSNPATSTVGEKNKIGKDREMLFDTKVRNRTAYK